MASPKRPDIQEKDLQGFKLFRLLMPVLEKLHYHGCEWDKAGNRKLHDDQYAALILLYFFNPINRNTKFDDIKRIITLVDGSLLPALPKLVAAMWPHEQHKAFKRHTHFEFLRSVPRGWM